MENLENHRGAVHDLAADLVFEVARLRGRNLVVHQYERSSTVVGAAQCLCRFARRDCAVARDAAFGALAPAPGRDGRLLQPIGWFTLDEAPQLLALAGPQVGRRVEAGALLQECGHDLETQRLGQFAQFGQRCLELRVADRRQLHRCNDGSLRVGFEFLGHVGRAWPYFAWMRTYLSVTWSLALVRNGATSYWSRSPRS